VTKGPLKEARRKRGPAERYGYASKKGKKWL